MSHLMGKRKEIERKQKKVLLLSFPCSLPLPLMTQRLVNKWTARQPRPYRGKSQPYWQVSPSPLSILTVVSAIYSELRIPFWNISLSRIFLSLILKSISCNLISWRFNFLWIPFSFSLLRGPQVLSLVFTLTVKTVPSLPVTLLVISQWDTELCHCSLKMNSLPFRQHLDALLLCQNTRGLSLFLI